ncbi:glycoside hydrolase family 2 protein [Vallitalea okinawensis]|uniref:glycoside hydrolase family 2 protein n=1 Tax=Vallitalea okinawensis TaxID=2078660 RepID=UPI000CFDFDDC|nr:glycoside hydrolase family 2 TIM barrel-domain containing protein [Vallitalea okinawensis]
MNRLFKQHDIRQVEDLEGLWEFGKLDDIEDIPKYTHKMKVPGCWEESPDFYNYRGLAIYKKTFTLKEAKGILLNFKGVSHTGKIYFDEEYLGEHYNAYTPFCFLKKNITAGEHEIKVIVDNRFSEESTLHVPNDYYTYGGITRGISLEYVDEVYIRQLQFIPSFKDNRWHGEVSAIIHNYCNDTKKVHVSIEIADVRKAIDLQIEANTTKIITERVAFDHIQPWSMKTPHLYDLKAVIKKGDRILDDLIERVGFRVIEVDGMDIKLNGEKVFIKGFNRHEDAANFGCSIPMNIMVKDIELMKDMGANAVRTCHYPNDELFLDLCDEYGLLVWEENHARGLRIEKMLRPNFESQCEECIEEMICNHYNHPSIFVWGILNECASHEPEGARMYQKQFNQIKSMDQSRPVTFACDKHFKCLCLDMTDIVSLNVYYNWYHGYDVKEQMITEIDWVNDVTSHNRPVIISEFGGGALYGYRNPNRAKWTEERQCDILEECITKFSEIEQISGLFIWQFCDVRVTEEEWALRRPRTMNNKGIVDEYRRPKLAYHTVKRLWNNETVDK